METTEKTIEILNDLIKINNDRIEGFEKAANDLEDDKFGIRPLFTHLASESRDNVEELTAYASQYGEEVPEGSSTAGALHRAWLEIKATFTGHDTASILDECERGEDAIKKAYSSALEHANEISFELAETLRKQQQGINESHDLIKSMRDESEQKENTTGDAFGSLTGASEHPLNDKPVDVGEYQSGQFATTSAATGRVNNEKDAQLQEFFVNELKDLLWAERKLVDTLPKMEEAATSSELRDAFRNHLAQTEEHVHRLEQIFGTLGMDADTTKCEAMSGIVDEGEEIIDDTDEGTATRDVGLIFAGQKVEHYEIASYGGMVSLANTLGYTEAASILKMTLEEEKAADALLTQIAENSVNYRAAY